jgi:hypothetical protein
MTIQHTPSRKAQDASSARRSAAPTAAKPRTAESDILRLQRQIGNRATTRLIQTKLTVGPAGDQYEQEADRVAAQVMTMPAATPAETQSPVQRAAEEEDELQMKPLVATITPLVQREAMPEEEEELQMKPMAASITPLVQRVEEEEDELQMKPDVQRASSGAGFEAGGEFEQQLSASRGSGSPLPAEVRSFMEPRFGADFSGVRLHTGSDAAQLNRQVSAQAFTHGQDIYLGEGKDDLESAQGKQLLAHELTHVVQQGGAGGAGAAFAQRVLQRVFDANTPSTYDDDGGHALAQHGPSLPVSHHEGRAKTNDPTYSSSGWASEAMMKSAVTKALATHTGPGIKKTATKWKMKWTVNVSLAKCGFTWKYDDSTKLVTKTDVDTAVVIFKVEERTGNIVCMTTAFPGAPAKDFNATA